jgi:ectoine hydroxylase-related dioxygenase (phytanoyl-CoA dioxygenase family)
MSTAESSRKPTGAELWTPTRPALEVVHQPELVRPRRLEYATPEQVGNFQERGYANLEGMFDHQQVETMRAGLTVLREAGWIQTDEGWKGIGEDWDQRLGVKEGKKKFDSLHDLERFHDVFIHPFLGPHPELFGAMAEMVESDSLEFLFSTLHNKRKATGDEVGSPIPSHQDSASYRHERPDGTNGVVIGFIVLDDMTDENGVLRFFDRSHEQGPIPHLRNPQVAKAAPYLSLEEWPLEEATPVYAKAGDVIAFSPDTVHISGPNVSGAERRGLRGVWRDPRATFRQGVVGEVAGDIVRPIVFGTRPKDSAALPMKH